MLGFGLKNNDYDRICKSSRSPKEALDKSYSFGWVDGFVAGVICVGGYLISAASSNKRNLNSGNSQYSDYNQY